MRYGEGFGESFLGFKVSMCLKFIDAFLNSAPPWFAKLQGFQRFIFCKTLDHKMNLARARDPKTQDKKQAPGNWPRCTRKNGHT